MHKKRKCAPNIAGRVVIAEREDAVLDGVGPTARDAERLADANGEDEGLVEALARLLEVHNRGAADLAVPAQCAIVSEPPS